MYTKSLFGIFFIFSHVQMINSEANKKDLELLLNFLFTLKNIQYVKIKK